MELWIPYILAGILAGMISAMFGIGAGVIVVPILALGFGFAQKSSQGMALFVMLPMALVGGIRYYINPAISINFPVVGLMAVGGVLGALIGSKIVFSIPELLLKRMFAILLVFVGIHMFFKTIWSRSPEKAAYVDDQTQ